VKLPADRNKRVNKQKLLIIEFVS